MTLDEIQAQYDEFTAMYNAGEISPAEYKDLLEGLKTSEAIAEGVEDLERKEQLNTIVNAAIDAASLLA